MPNVTAIIGPVGSGKTTLFNRHDPEKWVRYAPGMACRSAVGTGLFRAGDRPNAPAVVDDFVFAMLEAHMDLALELRRPLVCEFPRTIIQATRFLVLINHRFPATDCHVVVHSLRITEEAWEKRLAAGRWKEDPRAEEMDRARFRASVKDCIEATGYLRSSGPPQVQVLVHFEDDIIPVHQ